MTSLPHLWPFSPITAMVLDQRQRWLENCYIKTGVDELLADPARSVVVITHSGCGMTTSFARLSSYELLAFPYEPDQWPGAQYSFTNAPDHFGQWMAHVAHHLTEALKQKPELLLQLTDSNHEFMVWLMRHYLGPRQSNTWLHFLQQHLASERWQALSDKASAQVLDQLYGDTVADLYGQISESLEIARLLGWKGIYACIDINWADWIDRSPEKRAALAAGAKQILTTLTPLQRPGFGIKMGVHGNLLSLSDARDLVRGRATVTTYEWANEDLLHLAEQLIVLATDAQFDSKSLPLGQVWEGLVDDICSIWGGLGPAAAVALASCALEARAVSDEQRTRTVRYNLYRHSAPLYPDPDSSKHVVWRGMTPITLDETPFRVFEQLWRYRGTPVSSEALKQITGTRGNLDQNIKRIRQAIEPFYEEKKLDKEDKSFIYVQRTISSGIWLERKVCRFT